MSAARLYVDEDVHSAVAAQLRRRGYDVTSAGESGNLGASDGAQLEFAAFQGRAILTFNVGDFCRLHTEYIRTGREYCGVIVSDQVPIGEVVKRCVRLLSTLTADELRGDTQFLGSWR
ncbi:MAG: hypothetical protein COZ06_34980 [Armatimonadetes bacterium CG_4_10_14_3_um_filter_66_18]|nr:MAG: hypothetical protein COZ06_34980 [Armatimonadetes bacterium CG_4_10_14_3_um_filter_66_18]